MTEFMFFFRKYFVTICKFGIGPDYKYRRFDLRLVKMPFYEFIELFC